MSEGPSDEGLRPPALPESVTIIVVSKDDPCGLTRTLASIAMQDATAFDVVVVTKGSSDDVKCDESLRPKVTHIRQSGIGISNAFNLALREARGHWVCFLNGGDRFVHPQALSSVARFLTPEHQIVAARARDDATGIMIPRDDAFRNKDLALASHQASLFRSSLFATHGGYSELYRIRMDFEWMLRLPRNTPAIWLDTCLVHFEGGGLSSSHPVRSCTEELRALSGHRASLGRLLKVVALYLPFRVLRFWWRLVWS